MVASSSGSSDGHKADDSLGADLSDSLYSPYDKPVSFKSEVALFSPRDSSGNLNGKQCPEFTQYQITIELSFLKPWDLFPVDEGGGEEEWHANSVTPLAF